jgi:trans-aconitate 2-methyltransferase
MTAWRRFWEKPSPFPLATWDWQARLFLDQSRECFPMGLGDKLLDIGCGPGSLLHALADKPSLSRYLGLDVSNLTIDKARSRFLRNSNIHPDRHRFAVLGQDYLDLRCALPAGYTRLLALSVAQYYRDRQELETLLRALHALAAPGALILVADLPLKEGGGAWMEIKRTLKKAANHSALRRQLLFIMRCAFSSYRQTRRQSGLLEFSLAELQDLVQSLAKEWGARGEVITTPLTVSVGRAHLRFELPT